MSDPRRYDVLREEGRNALTQQVHDAGEATTERQAAAPEQQRQAPEHSIENYIDAYEARREAFIKALDAQRAAGKIEPHEHKYQLYKFENTPSKLDHTQNIAAPVHDHPGHSTRSLGTTDRADMVSQHAIARELYLQQLARNEAGKAPKLEQKADDLSRKPPGIER